jgi:hypothetical protein
MSGDSSSVAGVGPNPDWPAVHHSSMPLLEPPRAVPFGGNAAWRPLRRHQRADGSLAGTFNPGAARISWIESAVVVDFGFAGTRPQNRARQLNELTHELGDVGEIFLQALGANHYVEIHVTPENQRLQLVWTDERVDAVRKARATLQQFTISDPSWVRSTTKVTESCWSARTIVPVENLIPGGRKFDAGTALLACVCRYDVSDGATPVLSSTADFQAQRFHHRAAWHRVVLRR